MSIWMWTARVGSSLDHANVTEFVFTQSRDIRTSTRGMCVEVMLVGSLCGNTNVITEGLDWLVGPGLRWLAFAFGILSLSCLTANPSLTFLSAIILMDVGKTGSTDSTSRVDTSKCDYRVLRIVGSRPVIASKNEHFESKWKKVESADGN